jgi:hypothetical protein
MSASSMPRNRSGGVRMMERRPGHWRNVDRDCSAKLASTVPGPKVVRSMGIDGRSSSIWMVTAGMEGSRSMGWNHG